MTESRTAYIFGGTLDPVHEGHVGVIREIMGDDRVVVIAPTLQNPWKSRQPAAVDLRREMIARVLAWEGIALEPPVPVSGICLSDIDYIYVADFVRAWRGRFSGSLHWVVGPDIAQQAPTWREWDSLGLSLYVARSHANDLHSRDVRGRSERAHPAIQEFIEEHSLYQRSDDAAS